MRPSHLETRYKFDLSPRQAEVMALIERGRTNGEIAEALGITLDGAKYHVREILAKLGVSSREEAAAAWKSGKGSARWRWIEALAIGGGLAKGLGIAAAAIAAGGIAAVALVMATGGGSDEGPPAHAPSNTPTEAATTTPTPTPTPVPEVALRPCTGADFSANLEAIPDGSYTRLRLSMAGAVPCELATTLRLSTLLPPHLGPPLANMERDYSLDIRFPASLQVGEWLWDNWCSDDAAPWTFRVGPREQIIGGGSIILEAERPPCIDPLTPSSLRDVTVSAALGGKPFTPVCDDTIAPWLCRFAASLAVTAAGGDIGSVVRDGTETGYICAAGSLPGYEYSSLCEGAAEGEHRTGYPLALHGSEGGPVTGVALTARLEGIFAVQGGPSGTRPVTARSVVPLASLEEPDTFIVAIGTNTQPSAVYLVFRLAGGHEPTLIAAGISGDNAATILNGGTTNTVLGEAEFVPLGLR